MGAVYTDADLAAAWESAFWRGVDYKGPLNDAAVAALNPHKVQGATPAKSCTIRLKTEKGRSSLAKESAAASESTNP